MFEKIPYRVRFILIDFLIGSEKLTTFEASKYLGAGLKEKKLSIRYWNGYFSQNQFQ